MNLCLAKSAAGFSSDCISLPAFEHFQVDKSVSQQNDYNVYHSAMRLCIRCTIYVEHLAACLRWVDKEVISVPAVVCMHILTCGAGKAAEN